MKQDMELLMTESHMHLQDSKYSPHLLARTATEVCLSSGLNFVDKNKLEVQNHRRDSSIPSVSAGLSPAWQHPAVHT